MRTILCVILLTLATRYIHAQVAPGTRLTKINIFNTINYSIEAEVVSVSDIKYILRKNEQENTKKEFICRPNLLSQFKQGFRQTLDSLDSQIKQNIPMLQGKDSAAAAAAFETEAERLFTFYFAANVTASIKVNEPDAGRLMVKRTVIATLPPSYEAPVARFIVRRLRKRLYERVLRPGIHLRNEYRLILDRDLYNEHVKFVNDSLARDSVAQTDTPDIRKKKLEQQVIQRRKIMEELTTEMQRYKTPIMGRKNVHSEIRRVAREKKSEQSRAGLDSVRRAYCQVINRLTPIKQTIEQLKKNDKTYQQQILNATYTRDTLTTRLNGVRSQLALTWDNQSKTLLSSDTRIDLALTADPDLLKALTAFNEAYDTDAAGNTPRTDSAKFAPYAASLNTALTKISAQIKTVPATDVKKLSPYWKKEPFAGEVKKMVDISSKITTANADIAKATISSTSNNIDLVFAEVRKTRLEAEIKNLERKIIDIPQTMNHTFTASEVQIEFNEGYLKNIRVIGKITSDMSCSGARLLNQHADEIKFGNRTPISFSNDRDYQRFHRTFLFAIQGTEQNYMIKLGDFLTLYKQELEVDRLDYSPTDKKIQFTFEPHDDAREIVLKKTETRKLFEARVYTDFNGLSNSNNPNGIVQTEVERRFNLRIFRNGGNTGWLEYVAPAGTLSKLDKNNKQLLLSTIDRFQAGKYMPLKFASTLDLRQREVFSVGFDLNLFVWELAYNNSIFRLDGGVRFGQVSIIDSVKVADNSGALHKQPLANEFNVGVTRFYPKLAWEVRFDERLSFTASVAHTWFIVHSNYFDQVANLPDFALNGRVQKNSRQYNTAQLFVTFQPNGKLENKIFLRFTRFWQQGYFKTTFDQFQIGYSFFILQRTGAS